MKPYRIATIVIIVCLTVVLSVYDIFAYLNEGKTGTISNVLLTYGQCYPVIPMFFGALMGHLFWPGRTIGPEKVRAVIGFGLLGLLAVAGFVVQMHIPTLPVFIGGVLLGRALFPQFPTSLPSASEEGLPAKKTRRR